jgi:RNA-binding protein
LKFIGEIENVTYNGIWLIRSEFVPKIGSNVFNQQKLNVGRIINIIGPVSRPYIMVRPKNKEKINQLQIIGEKMYIISDKKGKNKKRKK